MTQQNKKSNKASSSTAHQNPNNKPKVVFYNGTHFTASELRLNPLVKITKVTVDSEKKNSGFYMRKDKFPGAETINNKKHLNSGQTMTLCDIMHDCMLRNTTKVVGHIFISLSSGEVLDFTVDLLVVPGKTPGTNSSSNKSEVKAIRVTRNDVETAVWTRDKGLNGSGIDVEYNTNEEEPGDCELVAEDHDDSINHNFASSRKTKEPNRRKRKNDGAIARSKKVKNGASSSTYESNAGSSNILDPNIAPVYPIHSANNTFSGRPISQMHTDTNLSADVTNQTPNTFFNQIQSFPLIMPGQYSHFPSTQYWPFYPMYANHLDPNPNIVPANTLQLFAAQIDDFNILSSNISSSKYGDGSGVSFSSLSSNNEEDLDIQRTSLETMSPFLDENFN